jgi:hypothetical protein
MSCVNVYSVTLEMTFKKSSGFMVAVDIKLYSCLIHLLLQGIFH